MRALLAALLAAGCLTTTASAARLLPPTQAAKIVRALMLVESSGTPYIPYDVECRARAAGYACTAYVIDLSANTYSCLAFLVDEHFRPSHVRNTTRSCPPIA